MAGGNYNISLNININSLKNLNNSINNSVKNANNLANSLFKSTQHTRNLRGQFKSFLSSFEKGIIVVNQFFELLRKINIFINVALKPLSEAGLFESFRTTLNNLLRDSEAAENRFKEMVLFAAKTPFTVPGVVEAGNQLEALGRYSLSTLRMLGDLAAASGKDVSQAIEAYTNLIVGRTGIAIKQFRALLISNTDWVRETGKQVLKNTGEVTASITEMLEALPKIIAKKNFTGLMEEQSKTFLGKMSNLADAWQRFLANTGDMYIKHSKKIIDYFINLLDNVSFSKVKSIINTLILSVLSLGGAKILQGIISFFMDFRITLDKTGKSAKNLITILKILFLTLARHPVIAAATVAVGTLTYFFVSSKDELEKLQEQIEATESRIKYIKNTRETEVQNIKQSELKIKILEDLINLEKKYSDKIKNSGKIAYKARLDIAEYNQKIAEAKRVLKEYVDENDKFTLVLGDVPIVMNKLNNAFSQLNSKFSESKEKLVALTERLIELKRELSILKLEEQIKTNVEDIFGRNLTDYFELFIKSFKSNYSFALTNMPKLIALLLKNPDLEKYKEQVENIFNLLKNKKTEEAKIEMEKFSDELLSLVEGADNEKKEIIYNTLTTIQEWFSKYENLLAEPFYDRFSKLLVANLDKIYKTEKDRLKALQEQKKYIEDLITKIENEAEPKEEFKNIELNIADYTNLLKTGLISDKNIKGEVEKLKGGKIKIPSLTLEFNSAELRQSARTVLNKQLSVVEQQLQDANQSIEESKNRYLSELQQLLSGFKARLSAIESEFKGEMVNISNIRDFEEIFDISVKTFEDFIKKYDDLNKEWQEKRKEFYDSAGKIKDLKFTDDIANLDKVFKTYKASISETLSKFITDVALKRSKLSREISKLNIDVNKKLLVSENFSSIKTSIKTLEELQNKISNFIKRIDDVPSKTKLVESLINIQNEINNLYNELYKIEFIKTRIEILQRSLLKGISIDFKTGDVIFNVDMFIKNFNKTIDNIINEIDAKSNLEEISIPLPINIDIDSIKKTLNTSTIDATSELIQKSLGEYDRLENLLINSTESEIDTNKKAILQNKISLFITKERIKALKELINVLNETKSAELDNADSEEQRNQIILKQKEIIDYLSNKLLDYNIDINKLNKDLNLNIKDEFSQTANIITDIFQTLYNGISQIGNLITQEWINNAKKMADAYLKAQNEMLDFEEKKLLNFARTENQKLKVEEHIQKKREEAQEKARKIELEARKKQFEFEKKMAMAQAMINIAVAVTKIFSTTGPLGLIIAPAIEALLTSVYLAMISAQEFPEYKYGGYTGNKKKDEPVGVVHGQEFVVNADATRKYRALLEMINNGKGEDIIGYLKGGFVSTKNMLTNTALTQIKPSSIIVSNSELNTKLDKLNKNLIKYLENPTPAIAYLNNKEATKITKKGINTLKRYIL